MSNVQWVNSGIEFIDQFDAETLIRKVELACRNCYKSEDKIGEGSAERLIANAISRGHESPLEHASITFRVICDRAILAEWTRHRVASYSVESTRYCSYNKDKFGHTLTCIYPWWYSDTMDDTASRWWTILSTAAEDAANHYFHLLEHGARPEEARAVLPNMLKTDIVCTMNIRELRHFIRLRSSAAAHPDIRKLAVELYDKLVEAGLGVFFSDLEVQRA